MRKQAVPAYLALYARRRLFQVIFHVTYRCNARCGFCLNASNLNKKNSSEMKLSEIEAVARSMPSFPWFLISGGEPFLRKDLTDIVHTFYRFNRIRYLSLPTNGLLPQTVASGTLDLLERCPDLRVNLVVSLDGTGVEHDRIRGVEGAFRKVMETLTLLKEIRGKGNPRLSIKIETVVSKDNFAQWAEIVDFVQTLDPDRHVCDLARGGLSDPTRYLPGWDDLKHLLPRLKALDETYHKRDASKNHRDWFGRVLHDVNTAYWNITSLTLEQDRRIIPCYAGRVSAVIYPEGELAFCELLPPVGNLRDAGWSFPTIWNATEACRIREGISHGTCHCFHPCHQLVNILFNPTQVARALISGTFH